MHKHLFIFLILISYSGMTRAQGSDSTICHCDSLKGKIAERYFFVLPGRTLIRITKPDNLPCEAGYFIFDIVVNRDGKIMEAKFNQKHSNPISEKLKSELEKAVLASLFYANIEAPIKQKGSIGYRFEIIKQ